MDLIRWKYSLRTIFDWSPPRKTLLGRSRQGISYYTYIPYTNDIIDINDKENGLVKQKNPESEEWLEFLPDNL